VVLGVLWNGLGSNAVVVYVDPEVLTAIARVNHQLNGRHLCVDFGNLDGLASVCHLRLWLKLLGFDHDVVHRCEVLLWLC